MLIAIGSTCCIVTLFNVDLLIKNIKLAPPPLPQTSNDSVNNPTPSESTTRTRKSSFMFSCEDIMVDSTSILKDSRFAKNAKWPLSISYATKYRQRKFEHRQMLFRIYPIFSEHFAKLETTFMKLWISQNRVNRFRGHEYILAEDEAGDYAISRYSLMFGKLLIQLII